MLTAHWTARMVVARRSRSRRFPTISRCLLEICRSTSVTRSCTSSLDVRCFQFNILCTWNADRIIFCQHSISFPFPPMFGSLFHCQFQLKGSVKEPNKFHIYETEKITRKARDAAKYIELFSSFTRDCHARRI